eukprot:6089350-Prymnesium_polylepis.1
MARNTVAMMGGYTSELTAIAFFKDVHKLCAERARLDGGRHAALEATHADTWSDAMQRFVELTQDLPELRHRVTTNAMGASGGAAAAAGSSGGALPATRAPDGSAKRIEKALSGEPAHNRAVRTSVFGPVTELSYLLAHQADTAEPPITVTDVNDD